MKNPEWLKERRTLDKITGGANDEEVVVAGFVRKIRSMGKKLKFLILQDGTGEVQLTFVRSVVGEDKMKLLDTTVPQSVISARGRVQQTDLSDRGVELLVSDFEILSESGRDYPIDVSEGTETSQDKKLDWRFLDLRNEKMKGIMYILSDFERFSRGFFYENGLREIHTPKLMGTASESGAEVFPVDYFGGKAYLAQSPQFYKQMAMAAGYEGVFEIGPAFRAEKSFTNRHTTEFTSLDVELPYIAGFEDIMAFEESWIAYTLERLGAIWNGKTEELYGVSIEAPSTPFPRITMEEALEITRASGIKPSETGDLSSEGEKFMGEYTLKKHGHPFLFLTEFPVEARPFYHMRTEDGRHTLSYDLLWRGLEITTGAQREHRYDILLSQVYDRGLSRDSLEHYLDFFKYGCPPHGGFGLGVSRFVMSLLSLQNLRDATFLPRDPKRLVP